MIRFEAFEKNLAPLRDKFLTNRPFPHIVIDDFTDAGRLQAALKDIPAPDSGKINKSLRLTFSLGNRNSSRPNQSSTSAIPKHPHTAPTAVC